jgi:hypothetical protein
MWVRGDLKDRLGVRNRRDEPAPIDSSSSELEAAPMFGKPHTRSISERSITDAYEPTPSHSPEDHTPPIQSEKSEGTLVSTAVVESSSFPVHLTGIAVTTEDEDKVPPVAPTPLTVPGHMVAVSTSPRYSSSDIPIPSPPPSPQFRHPSQAYPRITSMSYSRSQRGRYSVHSDSDNLSSPLNSLETSVRSPQPDKDSERQESQGTGEVSYTIVTDDDHDSCHSPSRPET